VADLALLAPDGASSRIERVCINLLELSCILIVICSWHLTLRTAFSESGAPGGISVPVSHGLHGYSEGFVEAGDWMKCNRGVQQGWGLVMD
jgi:hypothetical protein